ncbi:flavin reductase [Streptomyces sp. GLT-R25]
MASDAVRAGSARRVLVVGAERMTDIVEPTDRTISFLFADGAGAVVVGDSDTPGIGPVVRRAYGAHSEALRMTAPWATADGAASERPWMRMDGRRVFRWAMDEVAPALARTVGEAGLTPAELGAFVPHQANLRMIELMTERLGLTGATAVSRDVVRSGNTSGGVHTARPGGAARLPGGVHRGHRAPRGLRSRPQLRLPGGGSAVNRTDRRAVADVEPSQVREGFRAAMAQLAGGVVVVTTEDTDGRPYGFTATSFCSVSMDPALVLVCLAETSSSYEAFMDCRGFAVSLLGQEQRALATRFATTGADKFRAEDTVTTPRLLPAVEGALAVLDCDVHARHPAGDHMILVGAVRHVLPGRGEPLVYHDRAFQQLRRPEHPRLPRP